MPVREDVALAASALVRSGYAAGRDVAHIDEVIAAAHAGGQAAVDVLPDQLHEVVVLRIRADDARRMHDDGVQPPLPHGGEYVARGFGLAFGVPALHRFRREGVGLVSTRSAPFSGMAWTLLT